MNFDSQGHARNNEIGVAGEIGLERGLKSLRNLRSLTFNIE